MIQITKESIAHLAGLQSRSSGDWADLPIGSPDINDTAVTENNRTLKFGQAGFEES